MAGTWFRFCRVTALLLVLAAASTVCTQSADAGIFERVKKGMDYTNNLVSGGLDHVEEGILREPDHADFNRRASAFMLRQEGEGIKTFAEIVADGKAKLSTGWKGWKGKLADTVLGKAASAIKDKLWDAVSSGQRRTETARSEKSARPAKRAREAWKPWEDESSVDEESDSARTLAEIAADGEVPDFVEPDISEEAGAGEIDPLIALDIDEDEQDWYRSETGILDDAPLPQVRFAAVADAADRRDRDEDSVHPPEGFEGDCDDVWDDCPSDTYWTQEQQEGAGQLDEWVEYDEPQDAREVYPDDDDWKPWADGTAADGGQGAGSEYGRAGCDDVWADCPTDTDWEAEQQAETGQPDQWAEYDQPQDDGVPQWQGDDWEYESEGSLDATDDGEGGIYDGKADYERALGDVLSEDGSSLADLNPEAGRDYQMALNEVEWQVAENARIEAEKAEAEERRRLEAAKREQEKKEKARIEAEKAKARAAEERKRREAEKRKKEAEERRSRAGTASGSGGENDGPCGETPACRDYGESGRQMIASLQTAVQSTSLDMTNSTLAFGLQMRIVKACLQKCAESGQSDFCTREFELQIAEFEKSYRSAIENASAYCAGCRRVDDFDRDPTNSQFVRELGVRIIGTSVDSCGD